MMLKAGSRLRSQVCTTEVIVVRGPGRDIDLRCGGVPMVPLGGQESRGRTPLPGLDAGSVLGKRYDHESGLELLVSKAGAGSLSVGSEVLRLKEAKPLPASD